MDEPPIALIPIEILEGEALSEPLIDLLSPLEVIVLGYHEIPDQTASEQARDQYGERAEEKLASIADRFRERDCEIETRLSFTHDSFGTIEQLATEIDRVAIVIPHQMDAIEDVLVPVRGDINAEAIASTVGTIVAPTTATVTVYNIAQSESAVEEGRRMIETVYDQLVEYGVPETDINMTVDRTDNVLESLIDMANDHDVVVMGEDEPGIMDRIFSGTSDKVAKRSLVPVIVVRRPPDEETIVEGETKDSDATGDEPDDNTSDSSAESAEADSTD